MKTPSFLILFGLLAQSQAENAYHYPSPPLQLSQSQSATSFQQTLPPQQLTLNQQQQGSSYQQSLHQPSYLPQGGSGIYQPQISQPHFSQAPQSVSYQQALQAPQQHYAVPQQSFAAPQQLSLSQTQQSSSFQQSLPQLTPPPAQQLYTVNTQHNLPSLPAPPINQAPLPQLVNYFPQVNSNLDIPQNLPQLQLQPQSQQHLQIPPQIQQNTVSQQLPPHQQVLSPIPQQPQLVSHQIALPEPHIVTKNIYVHVAPEDPPQILPAPLPPRKNYKIIFIKAPSQSPSQSQLIHLAAAQQPVEEKTLVYVLVGKPQQQEIQIQPPAPIQTSKPEVYFIKYKAPKLPVPVGPTAPGPILADSPPTGSLPVVEDVKRGQGEPINSGEDSSSLFSGGLPAPSSSYGPPGYQKRNT